MLNTNQVTQYQYTPAGEVTKIIYPDLTQIRYFYKDPAAKGKPTTRIDRRGWVTWYDYNAVGQIYSKVSTQDDPNNPLDDPNIPGDPNAYIVELFSYDALGNMLTAEKGKESDTDYTSKVTFAYNDLGYMVQSRQVIAGGSEYITDFGRSGRGKAANIAYPHLAGTAPEDIFALDYSYMASGQVDRIAREGETLADYAYAGKYPLGRAYPQVALEQDYGYDQLSRLRDMHAWRNDPNDPNNSQVTQFGYDFDSDNNITSQTFAHKTAAPANSYGYDGLDRLTGVEYFGNASDTEVFNYDKLGNRQNVALRSGSIEIYAVNSFLFYIYSSVKDNNMREKNIALGGVLWYNYATRCIVIK
ncbi:MAG: hypothetical protein JW745_01335 [Sedimentisphaerales bacterium]|nr:hypothetical protein [Sedimentisphaerales bacterium]